MAAKNCVIRLILFSSLTALEYRDKDKITNISIRLIVPRRIQATTVTYFPGEVRQVLV